MTKTKPKVSIGLPVYNGENYLRHSIESILAQTFSDFELIISDNASTDQTPIICEEYARKDPRIRIIRHTVNRGAAWNFNHAFENSFGDYFKWMAHDDLIVPDFLEKTAAILDQDPGLVLCSSNTQVINEAGEQIDVFNIILRTDSDWAWQRYHDLLLVWHNCLDIFGLIRSDTLKKTSLIGNYSMGDSVLLARLGLMGRFHKIPEFLLINRWHKLQSNKMYIRNHHEYTRWFDPSKKGKIIFPQWDILKEFFGMVREIDLTWQNRIMCYLYLARWAVRYRKPLFYDIAVAVRQIFSRPQSKHIKGV